MSQKFKSFLVLAVGLGLAYWFVQRLDWQVVGSYLRQARIWPLVLAAILINLTMVARSLRWQAFLAPIAPARFNNLFVATAIGFGSLFVIGRAGEIIRPTILSLRERLRPSATLATILIERIYDTTTVVTLFAVNLLFFELPSQSTQNQQILTSIRSIGFMLLLGIVVGIGLLILLRLKAHVLLNWLERKAHALPTKLVRPLLNFIHHLTDGLSVLLNLRELAITIGYTICVWGLIFTATWLTMYAFGLDVTASHVIFILGFGLVGSVVPTPGGSAGAFHAAAAKGLEFLGLESNMAASVAIVYHLIAFGPPFLMGLYFLLRHDISVQQIREMIASEGNSATTQQQANVSR